MRGASSLPAVGRNVAGALAAFARRLVRAGNLGLVPGRPAWTMVPFVAAVSLLALLGVLSVVTLSALRAYVGGESLWTKGEKEATLHLVRFAQTRNPAEFEAYRQSIAVPMADRVARIELQKPDGDLELARTGLIGGHNNPEDVPGMIHLFRRFGALPLMRRSVAVWTAADAELMQLEALAERLQVAAQADTFTHSDLELWVDRIQATDARLTPLEDSFSATMGELCRLVQVVLVCVFVAVAALLVAIATAVAMSMAHQTATLEGLRRDSVRRLTRMAESDALTGLANRTRFQDRLAGALEDSGRRAAALAVLFIDLDRFKIVNDTLGHGAGDVLLQQAAMRLRACVADQDEVCRLGGDEFAVALPTVSGRTHAAEVAERIVAALGRSFLLSGREVFVSASVGVAMYPHDGQDASTLVRHADSAMYRAKATGRNGFQFYVHGMGAAGNARLQLEADLHHAVERQQFVLHYQPRRELATGRLSGVEALLRWCHPDRGLVPPGEFIPVLEETGLIIPVGEWAIGEACRLLARWKASGLPLVPVAVNVSARQFRSGGLDVTLSRALQENGVRPGLLEIELTESMLMHETEAAIQSLHRLKAAGVRLAVDDFGTGYSSLAYLKRFPIDALKIDRAFVHEVAVARPDAAIVLAIINLAHGLGLRVTAEGLETAEQIDFMRQHLCDEGQGFLIARPMDEAALAAWLAREHAGADTLV